MRSIRPVLTLALVVTASVLLSACTSAEAEPEEPSSTRAAGAAVTGTAPVMFAFRCRRGTGDATETYTTYSAAWEDRRASCTATRTTGSAMSDQQADAVRAADGTATLDELAAWCAVRGAGPWVERVRTADAAKRAAGLLAYCPGHPERDRLQEALATYRG
ncbi:hypothetical protein [Curtobacterium sp. 458]|uniref:hypothetical protein n=1 Tax=Curtobacterium sp. 458 TaxID=3050069 RepID=UPI0025B5C9FF|nr:hypothetical protein [Curtobacterium sp. 458]WJX99671.1 hypothetical protein QPJ90_15385 [Curtobacterium sp. 458]